MKEIRIREVRRPVPTVSRRLTKYELEHRDKYEMQTTIGIVLVVVPVLWVVPVLLL